MFCSRFIIAGRVQRRYIFDVNEQRQFDVVLWPPTKVFDFQTPMQGRRPDRALAQHTRRLVLGPWHCTRGASTIQRFSFQRSTFTFNLTGTCAIPDKGVFVHHELVQVIESETGKLHIYYLKFILLRLNKSIIYLEYQINIVHLRYNLNLFILIYNEIPFPEIIVQKHNTVGTMMLVNLFIIYDQFRSIGLHTDYRLKPDGLINPLTPQMDQIHMIPTLIIIIIILLRNRYRYFPGPKLIISTNHAKYQIIIPCHRIIFTRQPAIQVKINRICQLQSILNFGDQVGTFAIWFYCQHFLLVEKT